MIYLTNREGCCLGGVSMIEQDKFRTDNFWSRTLGKRLPIKDPAAMRIAIFIAVLPLLAIGILAAPAVSSARVAIGVSVAFAPPALPVYVQPPCPGPDYIWTPGYWAWDPDIGYYWVPGTWVLAPFQGALWTPGYWGWSDGVYVWYPGYWGLVIGFYGGIDYGFGYTGYGYEGGYWNHGVFYYNRSVNNVNVTNITHVYSKTVSAPVTTSRVSYNGGRGGITIRPTAAQLAAARERHTPPTDVQLHNERAARVDPGQRAAVNRGRPAVAATPKPGVFSGSGVVRASRAGALYKAPSGQTSAHARSTHPAGRIERKPLATAPEHAVPSVREERHAAPPARVERHVAPRNEPARPAYKPNETRHVPEHPGVARPQASLHAAPQRPETFHEPIGNTSRGGALYKAPSGRTAEPSAHARSTHPAGGIERSPRVAAPEHAVPSARMERHVAPRNEPARPEYKAQRGSPHAGSPRCC